MIVFILVQSYRKLLLVGIKIISDSRCLQNGMITALPYWLIKLFPNLTIEQLLLWLQCISGLVCIPIILIGRLYGSSVLGFGAACLAVVTHSYYNRTGRLLRY